MKSDEERWAEWQQADRLAWRAFKQFATPFVIVFGLLISLPVLLVFGHGALLLALPIIGAIWVVRNLRKR